MHVFTGASDDGAEPEALTVDGSVLYGGTQYGGTDNLGTIYEINTDGSGFAVLHSFDGADGNESFGTLAIDGSNLFGTTRFGGDNDLGTVFEMSTDGSSFSVLHSFAGQPDDGARSMAGLALVDSTLYGTTVNGGADDLGTLFSLPEPNTSQSPTVVASDAGGTYDGNPFPATATATGVGGASVSGSFTFTYYAGSTVSGTGSDTAPSTAGNYTVVAAFDSADPNYSNAHSAPLTFTIGQATPTVTVSDAGGTYNGSPFPATATVAGVSRVWITLRPPAWRGSAPRSRTTVANRQRHAVVRQRRPMPARTRSSLRSPAARIIRAPPRRRASRSARPRRRSPSATRAASTTAIRSPRLLRRLEWAVPRSTEPSRFATTRAAASAEAEKRRLQ